MERQGRRRSHNNTVCLVFLSFFLLSLSLSHGHDDSSSSSSSLKLELIHRHSHPELVSRLPKTRLGRIKELVHNDMIRQNMIAHKRRLLLGGRGGTSAIRMPMNSASDYGLGQYFVTFKVGTPAQKFVLVVDTGSELTWMNCRYRCGQNCGGEIVDGRINRRRVFWADLSSSFKTVPCFSSMCKDDLQNLFSLTTCPSPDNPCKFDFRYLDGSAALGFFANETVSLGLTNGRRAKLNDMLVGCSDNFNGESFDKGADGVMGLAYGKYSFTSKATENFGGKFSYCLVDHLSPKNLTNYLIFGSSKREEKLLAKSRHTELELDLIRPFYALNVIGISVGETMLDIPPMAWNARQGGGTILDTGTTLTVLSEPAYRPVMDALEAALTSLKYQRVEMDDLPMEYCFNSSGYNEREVPKLVIHFGDGNRFNPYVRSYIIPVEDGINCIGFMLGTWPSSSIIGNIMQQNYLWEFDLVGRKLGFTPSTCT